MSVCLQATSNSALSVLTVPWGPSLGAMRAAANLGQSECWWGLLVVGGAGRLEGGASAVNSGAVTPSSSEDCSSAEECSGAAEG